ncbi:MAG: SDR family NAD(P)-dependent oxidoreductase [Gaiellaceae bacterium]
MTSITGKGILLTGASSGIGEEATRQLAARGARLALVARREERLRRLAEEVADAGHPRPAVVAADLGVPGVAMRVAEKTVEALGQVDVLVNNAGASIQGLTWVAGDRDEARAVFETNLWSPLALTAAVAPGMIERREGVVVNTGSMAQVSPFPHLGHYSASRAALALITQAMRLELAPHGVRVVELALGPVDTAGSTENRLLQGASNWLDGRPGIGKLDEAARVLVGAVEGYADGVVFYPRALRWVHALPGLGRRYARRAARNADITDETVRVGGSSGAPDIRAARDSWEKEKTAAAP